MKQRDIPSHGIIRGQLKVHYQNSVMYVRNGRKNENCNILFHGIIRDQLTLSNQGYMPICFTNLIIPPLAGFC